ncbi:MAG: LacI-family transcriptional regulator, partial [Chloroflexi bacterium]|nr:LacI-family transcriptional regulator [Chloroflexota bacterium]
VRTSIPVVVVSSDPNDLPYCHLRTDDTRAGYVAIRHLLDLGRRRIAIVGSGVYADAAMLPPPAALSDRVAGAGAALREVGISGDRVPILLVPNTLEGGRLAGAALLESGESLPDGIFATTDAVAFGLLEVLRARGLRVPEDTAVVGHDDLFASSLVAPSLTTIAPPRMAMGRACIELLLRAEAGEALPPLAMLEAALMVRESTIGAGPAARRGFSTNLSDPQSWRGWREQMAQTELTAAPPQPVSRLTLDAFLTGKEVIHSDPLASWSSPGRAASSCHRRHGT